MDQLIANPAVQSAVVPFVATLLATLALRPLGWYWAGLGFAIGFYVSVHFAVGIEFTPLTSTRKIILLGLIALVLGLVIDWLLSQRRQVIYLVGALAGAAVLWVIWPVASRKTGTEFWTMIVAAMVYCSAIVVLFQQLKVDSEKTTGGLLTLGVGTGISVLLAASAKLGQLGGAIGASAGAYVLLLMFVNTLRLGSSFTFTAAMLVSLIGVAGVVYAKLPWYVLVALLLIPISLLLPVYKLPERWIKIIIYCLVGFVFAGIAIYLTWRVAGAPPY